MTKRIKMTKAIAVTVSLIMTAAAFASCGASSSDESIGYHNYTNQNNKQSNNPDNEETYKYNMGDAMNDAAEENATTDEAAPEYEINTEEYNTITENEFLDVSEFPLSTFSTDVDTASFTNVRRMIENREQIDPDAVRAEEFINYFKYDYPQPEGNDKISITTELSDCPWNNEAKLMMIGLQAEEAQTQDIDSNLVFLIDVSGSMSDYDKLPLVQQAFSMLAENLGKNDTVSIVTYAGRDEVALEGTSGAKYDYICETLNNLTAGGSTAGADGINTAYEIAEKYFIKGGNNRVILATDGDLNVGLSSEEELTELIEEKRDSGIFLSVLGFGTGNLKDNKLEALADNGNGNYAYIDSVDEAERVLVSEMNGTLFTVAKDAKVQVEFNPTNVLSYRLVGYENRLLDDEDFEDDTKDAGDIGSGQQVTALYEIILADTAKTSGSKKTLKYQSDVSYPTKETTEENGNSGLDGELLTVSVRYKEADENNSKLIDKAVLMSSYVNGKDMSDNMVLACAAASFAKLIRGSETQIPLNAEEILSSVETRAIEADDLTDLISDYARHY